MVKYRLSAFGTSCNCPRVMSPTPGRSTLITSAPNQASNCVQVGPDWTWVKSRMRTPSSALLMGAAFLRDSRDRLLLRRRALRVQAGDAAALRARRLVDDGVDQRRPARGHGLGQRLLQLV